MADDTPDPLVDGPMAKLRELTVDLMFMSHPETVGHFAARTRAVVEARRSLRQAGYDVPGDPEWEQKVMADAIAYIACSECGRLQDQHICSRCIKAFEDWSITG